MLAGAQAMMERSARALRPSFLELPGVKPYLRPAYLASGVALNLLGLALPLMVLQVFDRIIPRSAYSTLQTLVVGLIVCIVLELAFRMLRDAFLAWESARLDLKTTSAAAERLLGAPTPDIESRPIGVHLERMNGVDTVRDFAGVQAMLLLTDAPFLFVYLGLTAALAGPLALTPVALAGLYVIPAMRAGRRLAAASAERKDLDDRRYSFLMETLGKIHSVKSLAIEEPIRRRHERLLSSAASSSLRLRYLSGLTDAIAANYSQAAMIAVGAIGALMVMSGQITVGVLAACTLMTGRTAAPLLRLLTSWVRLQGMQVNFTRVRELEALPQEAGGAALPGPIESVELSGVSVSHEGRVLFEGVDLVVRRGEIVSVCGPNGGGKTCLLALMAGQRAPERGAVRFNGMDAAALDLRHVRRQIAYMPQHPALLRGTVLENLARFDLDAHAEQALALAAELGLDRYFAALPEGYDLRVGDGGAPLPQGVAQRICIVRALVGAPRIILFDEANSALDDEGDRLVRKLLLSYRDQTAIVLASFRPALLSLASRHYALDQGRLSLRGDAR